MQRRLAESTRAEYEAELRAMGVPLDWRSLVTAAPADEQNFYAASIVRQWLPAKQATGIDPKTPTTGSNALTVPTLPPGWFRSFPPSMGEIAALPLERAEGHTLEDLKKWFDQWDAEFAEFRAAGERPFSHLAGDYSSPEQLPIPNYVRARSLAQLLATRARLHLLLSRSDLALLDFQTLTALMHGLESHPSTLVTAMIRVAIAGLAVDVVKDGLTHAYWSAHDLPRLQSLVASMQLVPEMRRSLLEGEMAGSCHLLGRFADEKRAYRSQLIKRLGGNNWWIDQAFSVLPPASVRKNQLLVAQIMKGFIDAFEPDGSRYYPTRNDAAATRLALEFSRRRLGNILAQCFTPNVERANRTCARNQTSINQAIIACALANYRAAHGNFPDTLSDLNEPLPQDLVTGQPMRYQRNGRDSYILYSVGENSVDDDATADDWVW